MMREPELRQAIFTYLNKTRASVNDRICNRANLIKQGHLDQTSVLNLWQTLNQQRVFEKFAKDMEQILALQLPCGGSPEFLGSGWNRRQPLRGAGKFSLNQNLAKLPRGCISVMKCEGNFAKFSGIFSEILPRCKHGLQGVRPRQSNLLFRLLSIPKKILTNFGACPNTL